ncbi:tetratricopeptide repeat protein [Caldimonas tepidiphila]|uniref:tetratricopeptide repeat protein n=1 Tax=Caldimonas tepidiphila TaxID=2315841 RepID=UPI000E5A4C47|nr:LytR C-terminal domain-containing protein [Caldimonas tepidiphila]
MMKPSHDSSPLSVLTALTVALALGGCAHSPDTPADSSAQAASFPWSVKPSMQVQHGMPLGQAEYLEGRLLDRQGNWAKSEQAYRRAIAADAGLVEAYNALGVALARQGRLQEARAVLQAAVNLDPLRAHLHSNLGQVLLRAGQARDALVPLRHAHQLDPLNPVARSLLEKATTLAAALPHQAEEDLSAKKDSLPADASMMPLPQAMPGSSPLPIHQHSVAYVQVAAPITRIQVAGPLSMAGSLKIETLARPTAMKLEVVEAVRSNSPAGPTSPVVDQNPPESAVRHARLEIANGNGMTGAAARLASRLRSQGYTSSRLTNLRPYATLRTIVQYREGYEMEAQAIARGLPVTPVIVREPVLQSGADIRVVIGHDAVAQDRAYIAHKAGIHRADAL